MKSPRIRAMIIASLAAALTLTACKKDEAAEGDKAEETKTDTTKTEDKGDKPEDGSEGEGTKADGEGEKAPEVDETMFIKAYYEVTCVQAHVSDPGKAKEIIAEIMPRYGFDEAGYKAAETALGSKPNVTAALKVKMESCTKEAAEGFLKAGATDAPPAEAGADAGTPEADAGAKVEEKKKAPPKPKFAKSVTQRGINSDGVVKGQLNIKTAKGGTLIGTFRGQREGRAFNIPLRGKVSNSGTFTVSGKQGSNNVKVSGKLGAKSATGTIKGSINKRPVTIKVNAK